MNTAQYPAGVQSRFRSQLLNRRGRLERTIAELNQPPDLLPEKLVQLLRGGLRVLEGVVKNRRLKRRQLGDATHASQELCHRDRMIDVGSGIGVFAALSTVLLCREPQGGQQTCRCSLVLFLCAHDQWCRKAINQRKK